MRLQLQSYSFLEVMEHITIEGICFSVYSPHCWFLRDCRWNTDNVLGWGFNFQFMFFQKKESQFLPWLWRNFGKAPHAEFYGIHDSWWVMWDVVVQQNLFWNGSVIVVTLTDHTTSRPQQFLHLPLRHHDASQERVESVSNGEYFQEQKSEVSLPRHPPAVLSCALFEERVPSAWREDEYVPCCYFDETYYHC